MPRELLNPVLKEEEPKTFQNTSRKQMSFFENILTRSI